MEKVVSTWFYEQSAIEGGQYAQVRGESSSQAFRDVYRRCIGVFFSSARRANPDAQLRLFLNVPWDPAASDTAAKVDEVLRELNVSVEVIPYTFSPPPAWGDAWRNQFFVFDVLASLSAAAAPEDLLTIMDSDIVWTGGDSTAALWGAIEEQGLVSVDLDYPENHNINGLSRLDLTELLVRYADQNRPDAIPYFGGELVAVRGDVAASIVSEAERLWPVIKRDSEDGLTVFKEEAHFLSFIYAALSLEQPIQGAVFAKRIWTQVFKFNNVSQSDLSLAIWHLPAEKRYGIRRLFRQIGPAGSLYRSDLDQRLWLERVGRSVGVPRNSLWKTCLDLSFVLRSRLLDKLGVE